MISSGGFPPETIGFLRELRANNRRSRQRPPAEATRARQPAGRALRSVAGATSARARMKVGEEPIKLPVLKDAAPGFILSGGRYQ